MNNSQQVNHIENYTVINREVKSIMRMQCSVHLITLLKHHMKMPNKLYNWYLLTFRGANWKIWNNNKFCIYISVIQKTYILICSRSQLSMQICSEMLNIYVKKLSHWWSRTMNTTEPAYILKSHIYTHTHTHIVPSTVPLLYITTFTLSPQKN
jgi:hypothetical protein